MVTHFGAVSLSFFLARTCTNVIYGLIFLLLLQSGTPVNAQPDWTAVKAKMNANAKELDQEFVFVLSSADSTLLLMETKTFTTKSQVPFFISSQWLTAALLFKLAEEGKLSIDDPVQKYIPEFAKYFKGYITLRHCLSHMTGIEQKELPRMLAQRKKYTSLEEEVNELVKLSIRAKPGTACWFSQSVGLQLAGRVAEIATKKKFDILIKSKLLTPLGMRRTTFSDLNGGALNPSEGAQSTAEDYMRFLRMLLNKGKVNQQAFLSEASAVALLQMQASASQVAYSPIEKNQFGYAHGAWVVESQNGLATALAAPGLQGGWPLIDLCRGYAYLVVTKNKLGDSKADLHLEMKALIDRQLVGNCKQ
jgi:CubicO group peptidase (beta-lactamase class C family)